MARVGEAMKTTPSGVPILPCRVCGHTHPVTRTHCPTCGIPSAFPHKTHRGTAAHTKETPNE